MGKCGVRYLLDCALRGYHAALLAYGQTGSGKTYTITCAQALSLFPSSS